MALGINGKVGLLTEEQIIGDNRLDIFKSKHLFALVTDLATLLGVNYDSHVIRYGSWWLSSYDPVINYLGDTIGYTYYIDKEGKIKSAWGEPGSKSQEKGFRPIIPFDNMDDIPSKCKKNSDGVYEIKFGEYPQQVVSKRVSQKLYEAISKNNLKKTGRKFTFFIENMKSFEVEPVSYEEYEYKGKKYVRVKNWHRYAGVKLSNKEWCNENSYAWIEVSPITWYVDLKSKIIVSRKILTPGASFNEPGKKGPHGINSKGFLGDFESTEAYRFLNDFFAKEILPKEEYEKISAKASDEKDKEDSLTIEGMIEKIKKLLPYFPNHDKVVFYLKEILKNHNEEMNKLVYPDDKREITLAFKTPDMVYAETMDKLNNLYDKIKKFYDLIKNYNDMLDTIKDSKDKLNKIKVDTDNNIIKLFDGIGSVVLPFLEKAEREEIKNDLITVLDKYENEIKEFIESFSVISGEKTKTLSYNSIDELELAIRKDIHEILLKMQFYVKRRDLIEELNEGIADAIHNNFEEGKYRVVKGYLKYINDRVNSINIKVGYDKEKYASYKERMEEVLKFDIDYKQSNDEINKLLFKVCLDLCEIEFDLDKEIEKKINANKYFANDSILNL